MDILLHQLPNLITPIWLVLWTLSKTSTVKNARPEIWAYGFRKLWHYEFDPLTHQIFGGDVGENKEEEIDIVKKGANYGWPAMEGDSFFQKTAVENKSAYTAPVSTYTHSVGICIIGGGYYLETKFLH